MHIRIGIQTAFTAATVTEPFEYAVANDFEAFEWFPDKKESGAGWDISDLPQPKRHMIRDTAFERDIRLSVHARCQTNPLIPAARKLLLKDIAFARDIGAALFNIHLCNDKGPGSYARAIRPLLKDLQRSNLMLSIENTPLSTPEEFNDLFRQLRSLPPAEAAGIGMCLDLGHANLCAATRNNYLKFIDLLDPEIPIIHIHLHENYGDCDSHLPIFTGPAGKDPSGMRGFITRMQKREFSGCVILEQWPQPPALLKESRNRLCKLIGPSAEAPTLPVKEAEEDIAERIAEADRQYRSWREKLCWIDELLTDAAFDLSTDNLTYLAIYLRFVGTGEIPCSEDSRHFRPCHHSRMALSIQERLSKITSPDNFFIIRKIYPWLPSLGSVFSCAEPLTRIRDIAHRNDIPAELKRKIKLTLQNKLHRCAGPEDLVTSAALLEKITSADAVYSPDFVQQFKQFHEELKEFFNARSLEQQLEAMIENREAQAARSRRPGPGAAKRGKSDTAGLIDRFLKAKPKDQTPAQLTEGFKLLTMLRTQFGRELQHKTGAELQEVQIADIKLEDFAFVLLSRLINQFSALERDNLWAPALQNLALTIENLRLSGFDSNECRAIESEMKIWIQSFELKDPDHLIGLKAILDRIRRLAEAHCSWVLTTFPEKVAKLGRALGVNDPAIKVFCEADIRSHLVFQLSKFVDLILKSIRAHATLSPWDVIVPGRVSGCLIAAPCFDDLPVASDEPIVALLERAEEDEDIPANVKGIIVACGINLLSHFAVRARQEKVVLTVCEDAEKFTEFQKLKGSRVTLDVSAETVGLELFAGREGGAKSAGKSTIQHSRSWMPDVKLCFEQRLLSLEMVNSANSGSKADALRRLQDLSQLKGAGFAAPPGAVIPFGVLEASLHAAPALEEEYRMLVSRINEIPPASLADVLHKLQNIIKSLNVSHEITSAVLDKFSQGQRLIVRSSASCEDLKEVAGAGLYDSISNVSPAGVAHAVRKVWASLWTRRAFMNRKKMGIRHESAHMAVLIQPLLMPEISFIMHTVSPVTLHPDEVYLELAVGLGETLASGLLPGLPYRMVCNKISGQIRMLAFASFSQAVWPDSAEGLVRTTVDYSRIKLSQNEVYRKTLGRRLAAIGQFVEDALKEPQDIEGLVSGDRIYLVQSRPQQGIHPNFH